MRRDCIAAERVRLGVDAAVRIGHGVGKAVVRLAEAALEGHAGGRIAEVVERKGADGVLRLRRGGRDRQAVPGREGGFRKVEALHVGAADIFLAGDQAIDAVHRRNLCARRVQDRDRGPGGRRHPDRDRVLLLKAQRIGPAFAVGAGNGHIVLDRAAGDGGGTGAGDGIAVGPEGLCGNLHRV